MLNVISFYVGIERYIIPVTILIRIRRQEVDPNYPVNKNTVLELLVFYTL